MEECGGIYTSNGTGTARGVAILVPEQLKETVKLIYKEKEGRIIIIDFQHNNENYQLINIHCPNIEGGRKDFVRGLNKWVTNITNCLIVGDFNVFNKTRQTETLKSGSSLAAQKLDFHWTIMCESLSAVCRFTASSLISHFVQLKCFLFK
uniref:Endonuclease/exonuclease/phosphatase domain-containing protein n=1 Tax=Amphiprion percula TaxID=161767 RepID=A0A3P8TWC1_AMPPE